MTTVWVTNRKFLNGKRLTTFLRDAISSKYQAIVHDMTNSFCTLLMITTDILQNIGIDNRESVLIKRKFVESSG